jgi:hypothetical protein
LHCQQIDGFDSDWQLLVELQVECDRTVAATALAQQRAAQLQAIAAAAASASGVSMNTPANKNVSLSLTLPMSSPVGSMLSEHTPPHSPRQSSSSITASTTGSSNRSAASGVVGTSVRRSPSPVRMPRQQYGSITTVGMVDQHSSNEIFERQSPLHNIPVIGSGSPLVSPSPPSSLPSIIIDNATSNTTNAPSTARPFPSPTNIAAASVAAASTSGGSSTPRRPTNTSGGRLRSKPPVHVPPLVPKPE